MRPRRSLERLHRMGGARLTMEGVSIIEALVLAGCEVLGPAVNPSEYRFPLYPAIKTAPLEVCGVGIAVPPPVCELGNAGRQRFTDFFSVHLQNKHTRRTYARAIGDFISSCEKKSLAAVKQEDVIKYIHYSLTKGTTSTARQRLSAIRHLYNWLANGRVFPNPASFIAISWRQLGQAASELSQRSTVN